MLSLPHALSAARERMRDIAVLRPLRSAEDSSCSSGREDITMQYSSI
jgi:hypothetical protein